MRRGIILFDHGSRDAERNQLVVDAAQELRAAFARADVTHAYLELAEPTLPHAIAALVENGCAEIVVQPFFLGAGAHVKQDLTKIVAAAAKDHPATHIFVAQPLGPDPKLIEIVQTRIHEVLARNAVREPRENP